jgi:hypothetical protein
MRPLHIPPVILTAVAVAMLYGWAVIAVTPFYPGSIGLNLNALGVEWTVFYSGVEWFLDGNLSQLFDGDRFTAYLNATFGYLFSHPTPFRPWVYPPTYLLVMLPFGTLPFFVSYLVFEVATAGFLAAAIAYDADRPKSLGPVLCGALLGPAAAMNFGIGENAFLVAALLVAGLRLLPARPAVAGLLLSVLTIKPQFSVLVPVALVAAREWRALAWWFAGAAMLAVASAVVFGVEMWRHWIELALTGYWQANAKWMEYARVWGTSVYATLNASGFPPMLANVGQWAATLIAAGLTYAAFRRDLCGTRKIAVVLACTLLAAPHSSLNDLVLLSIAAALWGGEAAEEGASLGAWTLALAVWSAMLFNPPLPSPAGRLTPLLILGFVAMMMHRKPSPSATAIGSGAPPDPRLRLAGTD